MTKGVSLSGAQIMKGSDMGLDLNEVELARDCWLVPGFCLTGFRASRWSQPFEFVIDVVRDDANLIRRN